MLPNEPQQPTRRRRCAAERPIRWADCSAGGASRGLGTVPARGGLGLVWVRAPGWWIAGFEVIVVLVEVPLILIAARNWFLKPSLPSANTTWQQGFVASLVGNAASVAFSLGAPLLVVAFGR